MSIRPETQWLPRAAPARVLACGAFLKNRACLLDGQAVHWSGPHGDLSTAGARAALEASVQALRQAAPGRIDAVAHDLHPDFPSTAVAVRLAEQLGVPALAVQHHHAHVAVALAEQGVRERVVGIALDGVGFGVDGTAWGGELLAVGPGEQWQRVAHLAPLALPGGDAAAREPWRLAAAVLHALGRGDEIGARFGVQRGAQAARVVAAMLERGLNCPASSSAGRWFDAAAGALGLCDVQTEEAEAARALEALAARWLDAHPEFAWPWQAMDLAPVVGKLLALAGQGDEARAMGAAIFHLALVQALVHHAVEAATALGLRTVVLSGGCLANRVLRERLQGGLARAGLRVHRPQAAGFGDGGLALGQAWVAAASVAARPAARREEALA
jgi:hydrogenase maturation protein HypF